MKARQGFMVGEHGDGFEVRRLDGRVLGERWTKQQVEAFFAVIADNAPVDVAVLEAVELGVRP